MRRSIHKSHLDGMPISVLNFTTDDLVSMTVEEIREVIHDAQSVSYTYDRDPMPDEVDHLHEVFAMVEDMQESDSRNYDPEKFLYWSPLEGHPMWHDLDWPEILELHR
jgi:hypothetical protein